MTTKIINIEENLKKIISDMGNVIVAYSGGVDSSYLMDVSNEVLGDKALAVMSFSPSVAEDDRQDAVNLAKKKNWNYKIINTQEMEDENYVKNDINRCFFCKDELYGKLVELSDELDFDWVLNGSNLDDKGDYRPGMIRDYAEKRNLDTWDKPASPCLSSRLPYGTKVTMEALLMVSKSEKYLRSLGFRIVRVRHYDQKALIEIPKDKFSEYKSNKNKIVKTLASYGYSEVELDNKGFRSGSLNLKAGIKK